MKIKNMLSLAVLMSAVFVTTTRCWMFDIFNETQERVNGKVEFHTLLCRDNTFALDPGQGFKVNAGLCDIKKVTVNGTVLLDHPRGHGSNPVKGLIIYRNGQGYLQVRRRP